MEKKQLKIPKFIWVIAAVVVISIIFLFAVQIRFSQNIDTYNKDHASATSQISLYNDYLERASQVQSDIDEMKKKYEAQNGKLFSNARKSPNDFVAGLQKFHYDIYGVAIANSVADTQGRATVAGAPLYSTKITFKVVGTEDVIRSTLDYLELQADGAYYINEISLSPPIVKGEEQVSVQAGTSGAEYEATIGMSLYYFDMNAPKKVVKKSGSASTSSKK